MKRVRYDEYQFIADSYASSRSNIERYLSEAHVVVARRERMEALKRPEERQPAEEAVTIDTLKAFQSDKVRAPINK
eukprot:833811-Prorocentrum_minimum.AAC.1